MVCRIVCGDNAMVLSEDVIITNFSNISIKYAFFKFLILVNFGFNSFCNVYILFSSIILVYF